VRDDTDRSVANALTALLPLLASLEKETGAAHERTGREAGDHMRFDCRNVEAGLRGTAIACPRLDAELFGTYLDFHVRAHSGGA
jgi:hypothetical protein